MNLNTMTMNVNEMIMMTTEDMMMCGAYNNAVLPSPYFVKENHAGVVRTSCQDELFRERIIHLCGPVDMAQAYVIIDQLKCLEKENPLERIVMRISSGGGEVSAGLAIYDAMREVSCPIETVCEGMAASMAAVLPLPLVPATWTKRSFLWGSPSAASSVRVRLRPGLWPAHWTAWMYSKADS